MRLLAISSALGAVLAFLMLLSGSHADAATPLGLDVSWPQCDKPLPATPSAFTVVGVDGGKAYTTNSCFARQYRWASSSGTLPSLYMTLRSPEGKTAVRGMTGPYGNCAPTNDNCIALNYGYNAAQEAFVYAQVQVAPPSSIMWWLDVETQSHWSKDTALNAQVIQGAIDYLKQKGVPLGIYSTRLQWRQIAGGFAPALPNWIAGAHDAADAPTMCIPSNVFGGGQLWMVQYIANDLDHNYLCGESIATTLLTRSVTSTMTVTMAAHAAALPSPTPTPTDEDAPDSAESVPETPPPPPAPPVELSHVGGVGLNVLPTTQSASSKVCLPLPAPLTSLTQLLSSHEMERERPRIPISSRRRRTVGAE
jgi:hypothetical protein